MRAWLVFGWLTLLVAGLGGGLLLGRGGAELPTSRHVAGRRFIPVWMLEGADDSRELRALHQDARDRRLSRIIQPRGAAAISYAFFEFAPASGAGMGTACAGTTPTGAKGETLTFTRASTRYCMKGNETTGIANGDLVLLTTGQPAVMPGGDGTGALGLGVWEARTNVVLRSQEFTNGAWSSATSVVAAPIVTADQAVAPDGTTTAERVQVPAASASQFSLVIQATGTCPSGTDSMSLFVKGNGTAGNLDLTELDSSRHTATCAYVAGSWTLCKIDGFSAGALGTFEFGSLGPGLGGVGSAADVFVWGAQCEAGATASPYIPTAGTAATRVVEAATLPNALTSANTTYSMAATLVPSGTSFATFANNGIVSIGPFDTLNSAAIYVDNLSHENFKVWNATALKVQAGNQVITFGTHSWAFTNTAGTFAAYVDGVSKTLGTVSGTGNGVIATMPNTFRLGHATNEANGVIKQVCIDPDPTRCR